MSHHGVQVRKERQASALAPAMPSPIEVKSARCHECVGKEDAESGFHCSALQFLAHPPDRRRPVLVAEDRRARHEGVGAGFRGAAFNLSSSTNARRRSPVAGAFVRLDQVATVEYDPGQTEIERDDISMLLAPA